MSIRFLADADLNRAIVDGCLREERAIILRSPLTLAFEANKILKCWR